MHLIGCFYLILNQGFTDTMQSPHCLLRFRSGLYKTHRRTRCSFTNSFGVDKVVLAICILGLEFIHSNPRLLVGQKAASGWIFLFFTTLRESNIGWILRRALSRVNPTLHLLPASTMSECAAHTRPCLVLLEYHCQPCGLLWSTTSLHG